MLTLKNGKLSFEEKIKAQYFTNSNNDEVFAKPLSESFYIYSLGDDIYISKEDLKPLENVPSIYEEITQAPQSRRSYEKYHLEYFPELNCSTFYEKITLTNREFRRIQTLESIEGLEIHIEDLFNQNNHLISTNRKIIPVNNKTQLTLLDLLDFKPISYV